MDLFEKRILKAKAMGLEVNEYKWFNDYDEEIPCAWFVHISPTEKHAYFSNSVADPQPFINFNQIDFDKDSNPSLGEIKVKVFGGKTLTHARACFFALRGNISLDLTEFDTSNVTDMKTMFQYCELKTITFGQLNTGNVTSMERMFADSTIDKLDLSALDTSNVENMERMFFRCNIKELNLSHLNMNNVKNIKEMFNGCVIDHLNMQDCLFPNVEVATRSFSGTINSININLEAIRQIQSVSPGAFQSRTARRY